MEQHPFKLKRHIRIFNKAIQAIPICHHQADAVYALSHMGDKLFGEFQANVQELRELAMELVPTEDAELAFISLLYLLDKKDSFSKLLRNNPLKAKRIKEIKDRRCEILDTEKNLKECIAIYEDFRIKQSEKHMAAAMKIIHEIHKENLDGSKLESAIRMIDITSKILKKGKYSKVAQDHILYVIMKILDGGLYSIDRTHDAVKSISSIPDPEFRLAKTLFAVHCKTLISMDIYVSSQQYASEIRNLVPGLDYIIYNNTPPNVKFGFSFRGETFVGTQNSRQSPILYERYPTPPFEPNTEVDLSNIHFCFAITPPSFEYNNAMMHPYKKIRSVVLEHSMPNVEIELDGVECILPLLYVFVLIHTYPEQCEALWERYLVPYGLSYEAGNENAFSVEELSKLQALSKQYWVDQSEYSLKKIGGMLTGECCHKGLDLSQHLTYTFQFSLEELKELTKL